MSAALNYEQIALQWKPASNRDIQFLTIAGLSILVCLLIGLILSTIDLPEESRNTQQEIPKRIADFILEKEQQQPKVEPKPTPKPLPKPKPIEKKEVKVEKKRESKVDKPITKEQKEARDKAKDSGLLALSSELADLVDTSNIDSMVKSELRSANGAGQTKSTLDSSVITKGASKGSGGVDTGKYGDSKVATTKLTAQELLEINQTLIAQKNQKRSAQENASDLADGTHRSEEEISIVFDQNKSKLYSVYNRERRKNPGLKGKIILEMTITPDGKVASVKVLSSELKNPSLEQRLISRIKQFRFSADKTKSITVTYPIEFLPS